MQSCRISLHKNNQGDPGESNVFTLFQISRVDVHEIVFSFIPSRKETNPRDRTRDFPPPILFDSLFFFFHWVVHTFTDPNPERYYSRHDCPRDFKARHCPGLE